MVCHTFTDLSACAPAPRVVQIGDGVFDLCFPTRDLLPVAERRVRMTAAQVAALTRLAREEART